MFVNTAKLFLVLIILSLLVTITWSLVNLLRRTTEIAYTGVTFGLSLVSMVLLCIVYYQASCVF